MVHQVSVKDDWRHPPEVDQGRRVVDVVLPMVRDGNDDDDDDQYYGDDVGEEDYDDDNDDDDGNDYDDDDDEDDYDDDADDDDHNDNDDDDDDNYDDDADDNYDDDDDDDDKQKHCDKVLPGSMRIVVLDKVDPEAVRLVVDLLQTLKDGVTLDTLVIVCAAQSQKEVEEVSLEQCVQQAKSASDSYRYKGLNSLASETSIEWTGHPVRRI